MLGKVRFCPFRSSIAQGRPAKYKIIAMNEGKPPTPFTPSRGLKVVDFVCKKMQRQMKHDVSLGGSWFKLFQRYDRDSSGQLDFGEMEYVLRKEVKIRKTEVSDEELHVLWGTLDADGSGQVSIKEFAGFMRRYAR